MPISGTLTGTDTISLSEAAVGIDIGSTGAFVAVASWMIDVAASGGEASTSEQLRLSGDPIIGVGRKSMREITVTALYDEEDTGLFENLYDAHEAATNSRKCDIKWSKPGATTGDNEFTTSGGRLVMCDPPVPNATENKPATFSFKIVASSVDREEKA